MEQAGFYVWRTTVEDNFGRKLTDEEWDIMARWITTGFSEYYDQEITHWIEILPDAL